MKLKTDAFDSLLARARRNMRALLIADTLDPESLNDLFKPMADHHIKMSAELREMFKDLALAIPDAENRKTFFEKAMPKPRHKNIKGGQ